MQSMGRYWSTEVDNVMLVIKSQLSDFGSRSSEEGSVVA
jgi:hypothetical protein